MSDKKKPQPAYPKSDGTYEPMKVKPSPQYPGMSVKPDVCNQCSLNPNDDLATDCEVFTDNGHCKNCDSHWTATERADLKRETEAANPHNVIVAWTRTELDHISLWLDREVYVFEPSRSPDAAVSLRWLNDQDRRGPTAEYVELILGPKKS